MIFLRLFWEFFKTGLFAVGGGLATIPFLQEISARTNWFSLNELADMIAIAESTPGPIGVNTATYAGFLSSGLLGGIVATLGLICPALIIASVIANFMQKFRDNRIVKNVFYGLRPASMALISAAGLGVAKLALVDMEAFSSGCYIGMFDYRALALAAVVLVITNIKKLKLHPIAVIAFSAVVGIVFKLAG